MTLTVLDSNDLPAILADAGVTLDKPAEKVDDAAQKVDKADDKVVKTQEDHEDEDDNGLTESQRAELTAKMQKAIGKKHRMLKEAEEFAAAQYSERKLAERRAEEAERELATLRSKSAPAEAPKAPEKPLRQNFTTEYEYVDAMIQYGVDERLREKAQEDAKAAAAKALEERTLAVSQRLDRARELVSDFDDVVSGVDTPIPPAVTTYMEESEMIAELGYYFAKNPEVLVSLAKLTPHQQLVKIGKIESTLSAFGSEAARNDSKSSSEASNGQAKPAPSEPTGNEPLSKPRGKAAPVITPLDATGSAGISKDFGDMNIRESIEDFSKRNRVNLGMRKRH